MNKVCSDTAWEDYLYWQAEDKRTLNRINSLINDIERGGLSGGIGKPEPLRHRKAWSRRTTEENRLIYNFSSDGCLWIISCCGHYED